MDGTLGRRAQEAAEKASVYAGTPITHYFDGFGRDIINTSYDRVKRELGELVKESFFVSRTVFDITGNILEVLDPLGRKAEINKYDMSGYETSVIYDTDQRQVKEFLNADGVQYLVSETMYGESEVDAEKNNIRARAVLFRDQSGIKQTKSFDFKGNLLSEGRTLAAQVDQIIDWSTPDDIPVESEIFLTMWKYDALNRVIEKVLPDKESVVRHTYNRLGQMQQVEMKLHGRSEWTYVLKDAQYNARGQRVLYSLGNGIESIFEYDPLVFRLTRILSKSRHRDSSPEERPGTPRTRKLQDLIYTYDSVGNISYIQDDSQESIFFQNHKVDPSNDYTYDALYRLVSASGREHLGQIKTEHGHAAPSHHAEDDTAMARYRENYFYDGAGNMLKICHMGKQNWTKNFNYHERSQLEPDRYSNRLSSTSIGDRIQDFRYEGNDGLMGNITSMPNLSLMKWDFKDQLQATAKQRSGGTPETRGTSMQMVVNEYESLPDAMAKKVNQRLDPVNASTLDLMKYTESMLAVHETLTKGSSTSPAELTRYQFDNQLGSSVLELDGSAKVITYEEYFAYGGTSYSAAVSQVDAPKRYRYSAKEKDEESGLYYYGYRYYSVSIVRWISADPLGMKDGTNIFQFVRSNPICYKDPDGRFIPVVIFGVYIAAEVVAAAALTVSAMAVVAIHNAHPPYKEPPAQLERRLRNVGMLLRIKQSEGGILPKRKPKKEWGKAKPAEPEAIPKPGTPDTPVPDAPPETTPAEPESPPQEAEPQEQPAEPEEEPPEQNPITQNSSRSRGAKSKTQKP
ncbi:hypothetical protein B0O99DRAFT_602873 [Bisporella sp. PMI_857]|nr:hypothetical protein B0O99DRAFT_602873 [Bisporella sp. PMI_857]